MHDTSDKQWLTRIVHAGQEPDPVTGAVSVPIYQSSTFAFRSADHGASLSILEERARVDSPLDAEALRRGQRE